MNHIKPLDLSEALRKVSHQAQSTRTTPSFFPRWTPAIVTLLTVERQAASTITPAYSTISATTKISMTLQLVQTARAAPYSRWPTSVSKNQPWSSNSSTIKTFLSILDCPLTFDQIINIREWKFTPRNRNRTMNRTKSPQPCKLRPIPLSSPRYNQYT